jgi:putative transposase
MKSIKSYTCKISGNNSKTEYLSTNIEVLKELSWFVFNLKKYSIQWWFDQKKLYHHCRRFFPEVNSKVLQNFISLYFPKKGIKLPKKPIRPSIFIDQVFEIEYSSKTKYNSYWLKFHRKYFPLFGKTILRKVDFNKVKLVQIYKRNNQLYCKLTTVKELSEFSSNSNKFIGCDVNYKRIVFSDNSFKSLKRLAHRKIEHKKHNQTKRNLTNYSKDFIHKLTTQISKDLYSKRVDVLVLENLKNLRKSASRKLGTSKGRMLNYIINSIPYSMFQHLLKYKCLDLGIKVEFINPSYTSKTCSRCKSRNTLRPKQDQFICLDCGFKLNADLNGSRNIEMKYTSLNALPVNLALTRT